MTQTVFAHIGAFKTGTTYIQHVLWQNRGLLGAEGILVPGRKSRADQANAAWDLLGASRAGYQSPEVAGGWGRLTDAIARWSGPTAVMSMEFLSLAKPAQIRQVVADLAPAELHVVLTARDLARVVPAAWQERMKNSKSVSWPDFVAALMDPARVDASPAKGFWRQQDLPAVLRRWNVHVPAERIHVVTVPPPGAPRGLLLQRMGQVIGSDATGWDPEVDRRNESIGAAEAELLRRVNDRIMDQVEWPVYAHSVKNVMARQVLAGRPNPRPIVLSPDQHAWAVERAAQIVAALRSAGYPVVGDLADLVPTTPAGSSAGHPLQPELVPDAEVLAAAEDAIVGLVNHLGTRNVELRAELKTLRARPAAAPDQGGPAASGTGAFGSRVKAVARRLRNRF